MQEEKRPLGSAGLNCYQGGWGPRACILLLLENLCQMFYGWSSKEGGEGKLLAKDLLNAMDEASSK